MALKYYIYGEVVFTSTAKRTAAGRRLDNRIGKVGFVADIWQTLVDTFGTWPTGRADSTKDGLPSMKFCYSTTDSAAALEAQQDIAAAWDVFQDSDSWWSMTAVPV